MEAQSVAKPRRSYRGDSAEVRRLERRGRLIDAARRVYGERGFHQSTVKAVCEAAGLTERYFYESFANSEALFIAMHRDTGERIVRMVDAAQDRAGSPEIRLRAMLVAFYEDILRDPGSARLFSVDAGSISSAAREVCAGWRTAFGNLLADAAGASGIGDPLVRHAVVRAVAGIGVDWMEAGFPSPIADLVEASAVVARVLEDH